MGGGKQKAKATNARKQARKKAKKQEKDKVKLRKQRQNLASLRKLLLTGDLNLVQNFIHSMDGVEKNAFDIDCQDDELGQTALHYAAEAGLESIVEYLLDDLSLCLVSDDLGQTPLHLAAAAGHTSLAVMIADQFQDDEDDYEDILVGGRDNLGRTPLFLAAVGGHTETVRALMENPSLRGCPLPQYAIAEFYRVQLQQDCMGLTAIHAAAQAGHDDTVLELLRLLQLRTPGNVCLENSLFPEYPRVLLKNALGLSPTPLHLAAEDDHPEVAEALLGLPGDLVDVMTRCCPDVATPGRWGQTPFHLAAAHGSLATLRVLLRHHHRRRIRRNRPEQEQEQEEDGDEEDDVVDEEEEERGGRGESAPSYPAVLNEKGGTPLHEASSGAVVELLLRHRARVATLEDRDANGRTALHAAAHRGQSGPVQALLDGGCDPNARSRYGCTPLMEAVMPLHMKGEEFWELEELDQELDEEENVWPGLLSPGVTAQALLPDGSVPPGDGYRSWRTVFRDSAPAVKCLLDAPGIDLAAVDKDGKTAWDRTVTLREFWDIIRRAGRFIPPQITCPDLSPQICVRLKPGGDGDGDEAGSGAASGSGAHDDATCPEEVENASQALLEAGQAWTRVRRKAKKHAPAGVKLREHRQTLASLREPLLTGDMDLVRSLMSSMNDDDGDAFDIDCKDEELGQTALHYAAEAGLVGMVKYLAVDLSAGLVSDGLGQTPLHLAAAAGHTSLLAVMIAEKYESDVDDYEDSLVGNKDKLGRTPLFLAAVGGHTETVRALMELHAPDKRAEHHLRLPPLSPHATADFFKAQLQQDCTGLTAIHAAAQAGHVDTVQEILEILKRSGAKEELGPLLCEARAQLMSALLKTMNLEDEAFSSGGGGTSATAAPALQNGPGGDGDPALCVICLVEEPSIIFVHGERCGPAAMPHLLLLPFPAASPALIRPDLRPPLPAPTDARPGGCRAQWAPLLLQRVPPRVLAAGQQLVPGLPRELLRHPR